MTVQFTSGSPTKAASDCPGVSWPIRSNPALQKAETAWNTLYHSPSQKPNSGTNRTASSTAPAPSSTNVPVSARRTMRTTPPSCPDAIASESSMRSFRPIRRPAASAMSAAKDMNPSPPSWISSSRTA